MRARMALDVAEVEVEHREILLRDKPLAMLKASPKGTVPVLVTDNGVIDESLDIMIWALGRHDPENWLAYESQDRLDVERFLTTFKDSLDRYKYASRYDPSVARGAVDLNHRDAAMDSLTALSSSLAHTPFLRGHNARLLDVASFPFVRQFAAVEPDWWAEQANAPLRQWLSAWLASDRFKRIMKKRPTWQETSIKS